jgi:hypothetical protein
MSQPDSLGNPGGIYEEKPRSNVYTAMLGVSLVAMIIASGLLAQELNKYDFDYKGAAVKSVRIREASELMSAPVATPTEPAEAEPAAEPAATAAVPAATPAVPAPTPAVPGAGVPAAPAPSVPAATATGTAPAALP